MILRGLQIENWRCIRNLQMADLPDGIVVLHGPNRTGKSSLLLALRCCLFDCDHDAGAKEIRESIPWNNAVAPKVVVEFFTGGVDYRITKIFSKKKEGLALLEKKVGGSWRTEQDAPKEASRRTRELLGADKSTAGLHQLLWLSQGEVALPRAAQLDGSLQKRLVDVLGVMVTSRDFAFKEELNQRWSRWFTEGGKIKKNSDISQWEQERQKRQDAFQLETEKFNQLEGVLQRLQACQDEQPRRQRDVETAQKELRQLEEERQRCQTHLQKHQDAMREVQAAFERLREAESKSKKHGEAQSRLNERQREVASAEEALNHGQALKDRLAADHQTKAGDLSTASQAVMQHLRSRDDLDDRRKLLEMAQRHSRLQPLFESVSNKEQEIAELENRLKTHCVPDEKVLQELRGNRKKAASLRAQLQASELKLSITLQTPTALQLAVDGQPPNHPDLRLGKKETWHVRQRAEMTLGTVGSIELARMQDDLDLERAALDLAKCDREYEDRVRSFQENPEDEACLDRLAQQRLQKDNGAMRLKELRKDLLTLAPQGRGNLEAENNEQQGQRQAILQRRVDLVDWQPRDAEVRERQAAFEALATKLESRRLHCEQAAHRAAAEVKKAEGDWSARTSALAGAKAREQAAREELTRLGEAAPLQLAVEQATNAHAAAERLLAEIPLTEEEKTIDQRWSQAKAALEERKARLSELVNKISNLTGVLQGNEGLHLRRADAEAGLREAEKALAREHSEAAAHNRLRDLFDQSRENQVQQVMGPVAGRVLEWAKKIGLTECREVRFGDQFMPEGIVLTSNTCDSPIAIDDESYGTSEQLSLLVRLALGGILARTEPVVAILDDPLAHSDLAKHRRILDILRLAAEGSPAGELPAGRMQILVLTCHPDRFDHLPGAKHVDLYELIGR